MQDAEVEFSSPEDEGRFVLACEDPAFVIKCLEKYQRYRKGVGEFAFNEDPSKIAPPPFCARALTIVEDAAIRHLKVLQAERMRMTGH